MKWSKRYFFCIILFASFICSHAQVAIQKGSRPKIDLASVSVSSFVNDKIAVKFKPEYLPFLQKNTSIINNILFFGIKKVDDLNITFKVANAKKVFGILIPERQQLHQQWGFNLWYDLHLPIGTDIKSAIKKYQESNVFEVVEPCYKIQSAGISNNQTFSPNDARFNEQWNLSNTGQSGGTVGKDINVTNAWDIAKGSPNVIVAMIDHGIQLNHPDIAQNIWGSVGYNFVNNTNIITAEDHGTATAGIVGAVNNNNIGISGIAGGDGTATSGIRLMSCECFANGSNGGFANALVWAADHGAAISSNSWLFTSPGVYDISILDAIDYFCNYGGGNILQGGLAVFAAGNNGEERLTYPGCYERVIGVAATNNRDIKSSFSNYGSWVDICAPAGDGLGTSADILTTITNSTYAFFSGTSAATPHVAGVAALIASELAGKASADDVRDILLSTTDDISSLNPSYIGKLGTGRLNAYKALQLAQSMLNANTTNTVANFIGMYDCSNINLSWIKNNSNNDVMIAYSPINNIGIPVNGVLYNIGATIPNGGTIVYHGSATSFSLPLTSDGEFQYFKIWSIGSLNTYSFGRDAEILTGPALTINDNTTYTTSFEVLNFPNDSLRVYNPDSAITWDIATTSSHTGTNAAYIKNYTYTSKGQVDMIYLPRLKLSNADSVILSFWRAYPMNNNGDTLSIITSTDCGNSFNTVWKKGGTLLATTNASVGAYTPLANDWLKETVTFAINPSTKNISIGFKNTNNNGQNLYIDDISISTKTAQALQQNGFLIAPNPFSAQFAVRHYVLPTTLQSISVFNAVGQLISRQSFNSNASNYITIDMSAFANGLYEIRLNYTDHSTVKKIIKIN